MAHLWDQERLSSGEAKGDHRWERGTRMVFVFVFVFYEQAGVVRSG